MNTKKIFFKILTLILFATTMLTSCKREDIELKNLFSDFSKVIDSGNLGNLSLTIYYMSPFILTRSALSVDDLVYGITAVNEPPREKNDVNGQYEIKFMIYGDELEKQIDLLKQMSNTALISGQKEIRLNARIYYVFSTEQEGKILDVAMWGFNENADDYETIFVNGYNVRANNIFYDVIMPFLSEESVEELEKYITLLK